MMGGVMWRPRGVWSLAALLLLPRAASLICPKLCSGHGRCDTPSRQCKCFTGWYGADCSMQSCPKGTAWTDVATGDDDAHNLAECSNRGICDIFTGTCECEPGFVGQACERKTCPNQCNGHGRCQSMSYYATMKDPGDGTVHTYTNTWDAGSMYGCNCDDGYFGPDCSMKDCPRGDDPLTGTALVPTKKQFNTIQQVVCTGDSTKGSFTLTFRGVTTEPMPTDATALEVKAYLQALSTISADYSDAVAVSFKGSKTKACTADGTIIKIEFLQDFGSLPELVGDDSKLYVGSSAYGASVTVTTVRKGTKENEWCSNRGLCDVATGVCTCMDEYGTSDGYGAPGQRGDCGYTLATVTNCPGVEAACSGHGVCAGSPTYRCKCANGWTGADCSEMVCPHGRSWFSMPTASDDGHNTKSECSDMGVCDRNFGVCNCMAGFEGAACERIRCPGDPTCSGHGRCMTMALMATKGTTNGVSTPYTYGSLPNDPYTWDFDKMQGCFCDPGYFGYDCSLRSCPTGDDPETPEQSDEIQDLYCEDDGDGTLVVTFRESRTTTISASATTAALKVALETVPTINHVEIMNMNATDSVCEVGGHISRIRFLSTHGALPLMSVKAVDVTATHVKRFLQGTKEVLECSGRGLCDYETGVCRCFRGYTSSNGYGGPGTMGDCGYMEPIVGRPYSDDTWRP